MLLEKFAILQLNYSQTKHYQQANIPGISEFLNNIFIDVLNNTQVTGMHTHQTVLPTDWAHALFT